MIMKDFLLQVHGRIGLFRSLGTQAALSSLVYRIIL